MFSTLGDDASAVQAADTAVRLEPTIASLILRESVRPVSDFAARGADLDQAASLPAPQPGLLRARAQLQDDMGQYAEETATLSTALATEQLDQFASLYAARAVAWARAGKVAEARKDRQDALSRADTPELANNVCWILAGHVYLLTGAQKACDLALKFNPDNSQYLDSQAMVLLQLGKYSQAIDTYTRALGKLPWLTASLYGRGVARLRKKDADGDADLDAALKLDARVVRTFQRYGLMP
jgi:tetratricopeptide (TPR) repeat protein